ncbi:hypothetical protein [Clostridium sporogenes]|nr:hypothetical protein [Clostridium sporogenes]EKS4344808.1 hypothetical protein [Clostridium botulinum]EKS4395281.1 hypothetical protein [Clostridium botulinum]MBA4509171.1 hypothetical protein [Clostridium sporogenes]UJA30899.1 hypothetical protein L0894_12330 [Clostridium sporogenes]
MNEVTLILPNDMTILEDKYSEALADVISEMLTTKELEYLISEIEKKN